MRFSPQKTRFVENQPENGWKPVLWPIVFDGVAFILSQATYLWRVLKSFSKQKNQRYIIFNCFNKSSFDIPLIPRVLRSTVSRFIFSMKIFMSSDIFSGMSALNSGSAIIVSRKISFLCFEISRESMLSPFSLLSDRSRNAFALRGIRCSGHTEGIPSRIIFPDRMNW